MNGYGPLFPCSTEGTPAPSAGVFDSPTVALTINAQWASYLDGLLGQWLHDCQWAGDDEQRYAARQEVYKLLITLAGSQTGGAMFPIGMIAPFGGPAPSGWLYCDGAAVSRADFADLFELVGTTYGAGDGATTFNLPDLRGRTAIGAGAAPGLTERAAGDKVGAETHLLTVLELPAHDHPRNPTQYAEWAMYAFPGANWFGSWSEGVSGDAYTKTGIAGGGAAHNNVQPSLAVRYAIYAGQ